MPTPTESWQCKHCSFMHTNLDIITEHEEKCKRNMDEMNKRKREYKNKLDSRLSEAIEIVRNTPSIALLCEHGYEEDARTVCRDRARFLWDCGTNSGWSMVFDAMIREAKK